ncbi:MAG: AraC family transcriptional regulator [Ginsengibacter sp.]
MKAILQKVPVSTDASFVVQEFRSPYFETPWHFHPELELVLVVEGTGKRFVGNHICDYKSGNLLLLGSNLPHWYRSDSRYYETNSLLQSESLMIQFEKSFMGESFLLLHETAPIVKLLDKAAIGLEIGGITREKIVQMMYDLRKLNSMDRLLHLLQILNILSKSDEVYALSNQAESYINIKDSERINKIYEYVMHNFTNPISLHQVAGIVNMCPSTFCRYFKKRTRKNFICFLNEIRIGHACNKLIEDNYSITEICFLSGYNNIAFFNRQFKALKKRTPKEFRQEYSERQIKRSGGVSPTLIEAL